MNRGRATMGYSDVRCWGCTVAARRWPIVRLLVMRLLSARSGSASSQSSEIDGVHWHFIFVPKRIPMRTDMIKARTRPSAGNLRAEHISFGEIPSDVVADRGPQPASEQVERCHRNTACEDDAEHRHHIGTGFDQEIGRASCREECRLGWWRCS